MTENPTCFDCGCDDQMILLQYLDEDGYPFNFCPDCAEGNGYNVLDAPE